MNEMMKNRASAAAESYLTQDGVAYLWGKVKAYVAENAGSGNIIVIKDKTITTLDGLYDVFGPDFNTSSQNWGQLVLFERSYVWGDDTFELEDSEARSMTGLFYKTYKEGTNANGSTMRFQGLDIQNNEYCDWEILHDFAMAEQNLALKSVKRIPLTSSGSGTIDWSDIQNKPDLTGLYHFKGSVADYDSLPTEGLAAGDVYDVADTGMNYGWTGEAWDPLGQLFNVRAITNEEIDAIIAGSAG